PELEQHPFSAGKAQDRVHRVLHRIDEAGGALRRLFESAVEPHGAVEGGFLVDEDVFQVVTERLDIVFGRKVLVRATPLRDRLDDAADQLPYTVFAFRRTDLPAEILGNDDIGGLLRPGFGDFD